MLWKSIIRSSLDTRATAYPYCLYIRSLDLRNLEQLLEEPRFRDAQDDFFSGDMEPISRPQLTPMKLKMRGSKGSYKRLDISTILELVGESITSYISQAASENHAVRINIVC